MLSNENIIKEIGKGILIHPISVDNIRGNSLNLRASSLAWSVNGGEFNLEGSSDYTLKAGTVEKYPDNPNNNDVITSSLKSITHTNPEGKEVIIIPPNDTALIETEETISVNYRIGGTYHSKVGLVSQGIGHIGTTLDPGYTGQSLIAIHNHSAKPIFINVGDTFVTVVFNYLKTMSTYPSTNSHGHVERLTDLGITLSSNERETLSKEWKKSRKTLRNKMINSSTYETFKTEVTTLNVEERRANRNSIFKALGTVIIVVSVLLFIATKVDARYFADSEFSLFEWIFNVGLSGIGVISLVSMFNIFRGKFEGEWK